MIELRWLERQTPLFAANPNSAVTTVRTLQYRVPADTMGTYMVNEDDRWSDWRDVPVVRDDPKAL